MPLSPSRTPDLVRRPLTWLPGHLPPAAGPDTVADYVARIRETAYVLSRGLATGRTIALGGGAFTGLAADPALHVEGIVPPIYPEWLGERSFGEEHGVRFPYVAGEMAMGIATPRMVIALGRARMLGFLGTGGLAHQEVERRLDEVARALGAQPNWGANLIHSPAEPSLEERVAESLVRRGVPCVSASAYMDLTPAVVRCRAAGLRRAPDGRILRARRVFAKVSREEVAERFMSPAPPHLLRVLVDRRQLTAEEAALAGQVPMADDVTVESDSGGHTDNRPLGALLPVILALRDHLTRRHGYARPIRIGAAGGLGTPQALAAAFGAGAAYVVTGTVNQITVEAGTSDDAKNMLATADIADVTMAPAADMFEMGVRLQVLRRGTLFASRASRLYEIYRAVPSLEALDAGTSAWLEQEVFRAPMTRVWAWTEKFWAERDPGQLIRADTDPKHRMALVFRWYLGRSSAWAINGETDRRADYQIWCGPVMGAFNNWVRGSFLAERAQCTVVQVALNLLEGAAVVTRAQQLRSYGVAVPAAAFTFTPRHLS